MVNCIVIHFRGKPARMKPSQKWVRAFILIIGAIVLLSFIALRPILHGLTEHDRASAALQTGAATVVQLIPPRIEENLKPLPAQAWVRFHGELLPVKEVFGSAQLSVGQPAKILYRIGRSGRIYVDSAEPAETQEQNNQ